VNDQVDSKKVGNLNLIDATLIGLDRFEIDEKSNALSMAFMHSISLILSVDQYPFDFLVYRLFHSAVDNALNFRVKQESVDAMGN